MVLLEPLVVPKVVIVVVNSSMLVMYVLIHHHDELPYVYDIGHLLHHVAHVVMLELLLPTVVIHSSLASFDIVVIYSTILVMKCFPSMV
jgi:hypothetical protein